MVTGQNSATSVMGRMILLGKWCVIKNTSGHVQLYVFVHEHMVMGTLLHIESSLNLLGYVVCKYLFMLAYCYILSVKNSIFMFQVLFQTQMDPFDILSRNAGTVFIFKCLYHNYQWSGFGIGI